MSPAEEKAAREGLPVIPLLPHDALSVLQGYALIVSMAGGGEALVRLYTADEWLPLQHATVDALTAKMGHPVGEKVSRARAEELCRPLAMGPAVHS